MRTKIDSPEGRLIYSRRMKIVEPVFANTTVQKRMDKFTLRGKTKVGIQNLLYTIVHNIGKIAVATGARFFGGHREAESRRLRRFSSNFARQSCVTRLRVSASVAFGFAMPWTPLHIWSYPLKNRAPVAMGEQPDVFAI